jgi:guanylate kinase
MYLKPVDFNLLHPQPLLIVISGPSGVGKDAVLRELKKRRNDLHFVVTATSRPMRNDEVEGVDYIFFSRAEFEERIARGEFIEYANVYEDYKGALKSQVRHAMASGKDVVIRVDVQGAARYRELCPDSLLIFIAPSNQEEWFQRLNNRHSETPESLKIRVQTVHQELKSIDKFDYVVLNEHNRLAQAVDFIEDIIRVEHHRVNPRKTIL